MEDCACYHLEFPELLQVSFIASQWVEVLINMTSHCKRQK